MYNSVKSGEICHLDNVKTIADGIAVKTPGDNTFAICSKYVDEIVTVSDDETASAILALMERQRLVSEGAGAVAVAAAMFNKVDIKGKKVCCVVSGGNIDVTILSRVISRGLLSSGRSLSIRMELTDKPGQLEQVSKIIADLGGNIVSIYHDRYDLNIGIVSCILDLRIETRDFDHINTIISKLKEEGFKLVD
jgi:threonine dehydratase